MPSPFPGMDPYLEGDMWQEFHETLASAIRAQLMPQLTPKYVALLAKRYVVDRPALGIFDVPPQRTIYPDVHVVATPAAPASAQPGRVGTTVAEPAVEPPSLEEVPQLGIEIRDVAQRLLVTMIEILAPVNKRGEAARDYAQRRLELLRTQTHLPEIDLLRQGLRIPLFGEPPPASYYIYLSRAERRPFTQVWPISLRAALPTVPVPLRHPDADVALDMQTAVQECFALVGYERLLDYSDAPPSPELSAVDLAWVEEVLQIAGYRGGSRPQ